MEVGGAGASQGSQNSSLYTRQGPMRTEGGYLTQIRKALAEGADMAFCKRWTNAYCLVGKGLEREDNHHRLP